MNPTKKNDRQDGGAGRQDQGGMGRQQDEQKQDQQRRPDQNIEKDLDE